MAEQQERIFRYKLDFYYQSAVIYLLTLLVYGGIRGKLIEKKLEYVLDDPLMYVIVFFVAMSLVSLLLNLIRRRRLIITETTITFQNRWHQRVLPVTHIEWIHIGREARRTDQRTLPGDHDQAAGPAACFPGPRRPLRKREGTGRGNAAHRGEGPGAQAWPLGKIH